MIERFGRAILRIEEEQVLIPMAAPFLEKSLYETSAFPNISDDDQVDSMSQIVANLANAIAQAQQKKIWMKGPIATSLLLQARRRNIDATATAAPAGRPSRQLP